MYLAVHRGTMNCFHNSPRREAAAQNLMLKIG